MLSHVSSGRSGCKVKQMIHIPVTPCLNCALLEEGVVEEPALLCPVILHMVCRQGFPWSLWQPHALHNYSAPQWVTQPPQWVTGGGASYSGPLVSYAPRPSHGQSGAGIPWSVFLVYFQNTKDGKQKLQWSSKGTKNQKMKYPFLLKIMGHSPCRLNLK